ncbi:5-methylcytosine-specific restriction enzyme subunit McrC [Bradyrhizobium sp. LB13.1]
MTTDTSTIRSLDAACISRSAFDWLCALTPARDANGSSIGRIEGRSSLRLGSYVGCLETPCGTRLEILPKHYDGEECTAQSRLLLRRMIQIALDLPAREVGEADLHLFDAPMSEWVIGKFLLLLKQLVKRGVRFSYERVEDEQVFMRGQLNVAKQLRQSPGRQHYFQINHDIFSGNLPENRLIKSALEIACRATQDALHWRLGHELRVLLHEIAPSVNVWSDFADWRNDRLSAGYQAIKPWCELVLRQKFPLALSQDWRGISLLFPMEKLFERYVAHTLKRQLSNEASIKLQARLYYLCGHNEGSIFRLEPDFLVTHSGVRWILDAKWKRIDGSKRQDNYGLHQADFYQLFAYGHKYLECQPAGELVLVYPKTSSFPKPLPPFDLPRQLRLWVLPLDLEEDSLDGVEMTTLPLSGSPDGAVSDQLRPPRSNGWTDHTVRRLGNPAKFI